MDCRKDSKRKDSDADVDEMDIDQDDIPMPSDVNEGKNLKRKVEETVSESSIEELEDDENSDETDAEISSDTERMLALSDGEDEPGDNKGK